MLAGCAHFHHQVRLRLPDHDKAEALVEATGGIHLEHMQVY